MIKLQTKKLNIIELLKKLQQIYRYCYLKLARRELAEDATSEVFIKAMTRLDTWHGHGPFAGWLFRIVMLAVTIGGIFIVSTLIGVLSSGIEGKLDQLRINCHQAAAIGSYRATQINRLG